VSAAVATLSNNQDISSLVPTPGTPQTTVISVPGGTIGGPTFTAHGLEPSDYRIVPRVSLLDSWRVNDVGVFSKQSASTTTFTLPTIPPTMMPTNALQWIAHTMFMTPTTYLGNVVYGRSFTSNAMSFAAVYNPPTITPQTGPSGTTFTISGQFAPQYIGGVFHAMIAVGSTTYAIDHSYYVGTSGSFNFSTVPIPSGGSGPYSYEATTYDAYSQLGDGGIGWLAGIKRFFGTAPNQALGVTGPSASVAVPHGGGCATANVFVITTGLTQPTYVTFTQSAGAAGLVTVTPAHPVVQPGTGSTPVSHSVPVSICSSASSTAGQTANIQIDAASLGLAALIEAVGTISVFTN
jgi:hypothetical protein